MSWEPRRPAVAVKAIQPKTLIQPVIQLRMGTHDFQLITATQWY
jgi:hypothetical protein